LKNQFETIANIAEQAHAVLKKYRMIFDNK